MPHDALIILRSLSWATFFLKNNSSVLVLCCVVLCRVVSCRVVSCRVVLCCVVLCCVVLCCVVLCCVVLCCVVLCCAVCCVVLCCVVLCCVVLCCVVLCCVVLCCVVLCCVGPLCGAGGESSLEFLDEPLWTGVTKAPFPDPPPLSFWGLERPPPPPPRASQIPPTPVTCNTPGTAEPALHNRTLEGRAPYESSRGVSCSRGIRQSGLRLSEREGTG